jgi:hypothetical protein
MQKGDSYALHLQVQRRGAHHERCRDMRVRVLEELALQLRAREEGSTKTPGRSTHPKSELRR